MLKFITKMDNDSISDRFEAAKHVSDYIGFIVNLAFLSIAIAALNKVDPSSGKYGPKLAVYFGKYVTLAFLFALSLTMLVSLVGVTQVLVRAAVNVILPTSGAPGSWGPVRWIAAFISVVIVVTIMTGFQVGLPILFDAMGSAPQ